MFYCGKSPTHDYFNWLATMVTTDQPPDEAEGSSGSAYAYAAETIGASLQHQIKFAVYDMVFS